MEYNYTIGDKEMLAIVKALRDWGYFLEGAKHQIEVITDYKNLQGFTTTNLLTRGHWYKQLACFDYIIRYRPVKLRGKLESLTGESEDLPQKEDKHLIFQNQALLRPEQLINLLINLLAPAQIRPEELINLPINPRTPA